MGKILLGVTSPWAWDGSELRDGNAVGVRLDPKEVLVHGTTEERLSGRRYDPYITLSVQRVLNQVGARHNDELHVALSSALGPVYSPEQARNIFTRATGLTPTSMSVVVHHESHARETFTPSPFNKALVFVVDSMGNQINNRGEQIWETQTVYLAERRPDGQVNLEVLARDFTDQPGYGQLFRAITRYVGFPGYHHTSKVMSFAGIGHSLEPRLPLPHAWADDGTPHIRWNLQPDDPIGSLHAWLTSLKYNNRGPRDDAWYRSGNHVSNGRATLRRIDLELSVWVQRGWEAFLLQRVEQLVALTGIHNICLGGGVALNCVANALLSAASFVDGVHIGAAPGDHGQGLGNVLHLVNQHASEVAARIVPPYFGQDRANDLDLDNPERCADMIEEGAIVAVCRGTAEFGPRALGHRSLLTLPRIDATERLRAIKSREDYQPFAVCVTNDYAHKSLDHLYSPCMSFAPRVHGQALIDLRDVVHDDSTCRIQTVSAQTDPWLYRLLRRLEELGRPPIVVNTSLNLRGEPMVDRVESAGALEKKFSADIVLVDPANVDAFPVG